MLDENIVEVIDRAFIDNALPAPSSSYDYTPKSFDLYTVISWLEYDRGVRLTERETVELEEALKQGNWYEYFYNLMKKYIKRKKTA